MTLGSVWLLYSWSNSPAYKPSLLQQSVSWQLWSSPTDIKLHTDHPAIVNSSARIQTSSHLASENWRHYSLPPFISIQNSQICQLSQYLSQSSLWDPNHTVQAWNATVPAQQRRHQHGRSRQTSETIALFLSLYLESFACSKADLVRITCLIVFENKMHLLREVCLLCITLFMLALS